MVGPEAGLADTGALRRSDRLSGLGRAALPVVSVLLFGVLVVAAVLTSARWGYDYQAYAQAAERLLAGRPLYDPSVDLAGGFAIYLYPPPFALAFVPFALLGEPVGIWAWTALLAVATVLAAAAMPVSPRVRWAVVLLAALSWPVLYAIRLGQVSSLLLLLFALGWRWLARPAPFGAMVGLGGLVKVQPGLLALWAIATGRLRAALVAVGVAALIAVVTLPVVGLGAWVDYLAILRRVSEPITTPHNFTLGAALFGLGVPAAAAAMAHWLVVAFTVAVAVVAALRRPAEASYMVAVVATQVVSPLLWDHYAVILLLPVAWLLAHGHWWAVLIPLATSLPLVGLTPPIVYPIVFLVALVAPVLVAQNPRSVP